jgi:hypothetical protein
MTAVAFLEACYGIKPGEREFRLALAYNMLIPAAVSHCAGRHRGSPALKQANSPP